MSDMITIPTIKIITVVGARPNFMKVAPIIREIQAHNASGSTPLMQHLLVHTGQHYDALMSDRFFEDLSLPQPDIHLGVGSGTPAAQTAFILEKFETVLEQVRPDLVIVVGDVNSTFACALATAKSTARPNSHRPLLAHVESGLRSFDKAMPEEINRVVTDHLADILFVTEQSGLENLRREGIDSEKIHFVGNTMIDSLLAFESHAEESGVLDSLGLRVERGNGGRLPAIQPYALMTLHRPSNVDEATSFMNILRGIKDLANRVKVIFPVHPRTRKRIAAFGLASHFVPESAADGTGIVLIDSLGYLDFLCLMKSAAVVLTDSGGIQEETTCLGVPCVTLRENTERPVTVEHGTNVIAGTSVAGIRAAIDSQMSRTVKPCAPEKWDGRAAQRIVETVAEIFGKRGNKSLDNAEVTNQECSAYKTETLRY